jgi:hypothetical protein
MDDRDKSKFRDLFDKLTLHQDHLNEDYIDTLIAFVLFEYPQNRIEVYKYKIYFMIINRLKIDEIINSNLQGKGEELKSYMEEMIEEDESLSALNQNFKQTFALQIKNKSNNPKPVREYKEKENNLNLNLVSNSSNLNSLNNLNSSNLNQNSSSFRDINRTESINLNLEASKSRMSLPENLIENLKESPQNTSKQNNLKSFELDRKESKSNMMNMSFMSNLSLEASSKVIEDIKNKIDLILNTIGTEKNLIDFVKNYLQENKPKQIELFSQFGFFVDTSINKIKALPDEYKLKFLTIYAKVYFIFTEKQKQKIIERIKSEILYEGFFEENSTNLIFNVLFENFKNKNPRDFLINLLKKSMKESRSDDLLKLMENVKNLSDISDLFYLFMLNKLYFFFDEVLYHKLLFLLYSHLTQNPNFTDERCSECIYNLFVIYKFFGGKQNMADDYLDKDPNTRQVIFRKMDLINIKNQNTIDSNIFFSKSEAAFCKKIYEVINRFYNFDKKVSMNKLLTPRNFKFTMNLVELFIRKENSVYSKENIKLYRENLIKLDKSLYETYTEFANLDPYIVNQKYETTMYKDQLEAFKEVERTLYYYANNFKTIHLSVYPFGSITQFLGNKESDLDIYMHIEGEKEDKLQFLKFIWRKFEREYEGHRTISKRLITITYYNKKGIKIDLNYFGVCSVLNSALLRVYSQCDERFAILAHNIKNVIKSLKLNNTDDVKVYLNSFCWMTLLLTFLQDIVQPPVLPKILCGTNRVIRRIEAAGSEKKKKDGEKKQYFKTQKTFEDVMNTIQFRDYEINDTFCDEFQQIYENFSKNCEEKNQMSLSELFVKFLEFVIFYFKYDSIFVHSSFSGECFMNKGDIKNLEFNDKHFYEMSKNFLKKDKAEILIREPFDYGYNPAQTMFKEKTSEFSNKLKDYYFSIIETGELFRSEK